MLVCFAPSWLGEPQSQLIGTNVLGGQVSEHQVLVGQDVGACVAEAVGGVEAGRGSQQRQWARHVRDSTCIPGRELGRGGAFGLQGPMRLFSRGFEGIQVPLLSHWMGYTPRALTRGLGSQEKCWYSLLPLLGLPLHLLEPVHCLVKIKHCRTR